MTTLIASFLVNPASSICSFWYFKKRRGGLEDQCLNGLVHPKHGLIHLLLALSCVFNILITQSVSSVVWACFSEHKPTAESEFLIRPVVIWIMTCGHQKITLIKYNVPSWTSCQIFRHFVNTHTYYLEGISRNNFYTPGISEKMFNGLLYL